MELQDQSQGRAMDVQLQISWIVLRESSRSVLEPDEEIDLIPEFLHMLLHSSIVTSIVKTNRFIDCAEENRAFGKI